MTNKSQEMIEKKLVWTGRIIAILPVFILLFAAVAQLLKINGVAEGFAHLGWPMNQSTGLAILQICCVLLYLLPRSAVIGAILLTGYLGGAIAVHVRVGDATFIQIMIGILLWGSLYLRDPLVRALIPFRK